MGQVMAARHTKREQLLQAARDEFALRGYHGTTVRDIATRSGVAAGTFYLYFPTKEACFLSLIDELHAEVLAAVIAARTGLTDPLDKLVASVGAVLRIFAANASLARIVLVHAPGTDPSFDRRLQELHLEFAQLVRADLDEAVAAGGIPAQATDTAALAVIGAVYEVTVAHLDDRTTGETGAALATFIRRAVGSWR